jgi:hypothetical protein
MAAVFPQMRSYPVRTILYCHSGCVDRIRMAATTGISNRSHMIDINAEAWN